MKIAEYILVTVTDPKFLSSEVNNRIKEGYQPFGSPVAMPQEYDGQIVKDIYYIYCQPMVKYE